MSFDPLDHPVIPRKPRPESPAAWTPPPTERIIRVPKGEPIPDGFRFKKLLGQETGLEFGAGSGFTADLVLVEEVEPDAK